MKVVIDTREQKPFTFLQCGMDIETAAGTLPIGDYSIAGLENHIAVERKSLPDLVQCLGRERERFAREMMRAAALESFAVVIEAPWQALAEGKYKGNLNPGAACASVAAFTARHRIPFFFAGTRGMAERFTAVFLRQYLKGKEHELQAVNAALQAGKGQ